MISVHNLKKSFGNVQVLKGINIEIRKGPEFSISCTGKAGEENKGRDGGSHPFWKYRPGA